MEPKQLMNTLEAGGYDALLAELYAPEDSVIENQRRRYGDALRAFCALYGEGRSVGVYSTPGRTEIGGNHTDHNNGKVMAAAVNLDIIAVVAQNDDNTVRVQSEGFDSADEVDLGRLSPLEAEKGSSAAMIRGVAAAVAKRGGKIGGFDAYTTSDVLQGSGLSSSAAFEVCMGAVFSHEFNGDRFSAIELGLMGQYAENVFFGKPSGLMDQTACACGSAITIDFADPADPKVETIPFPLADFGYHLVITDTKGSHADLTPDYAAIRAEMESVAAFFGKQVLQQVDRADFFAKLAAVRAQAGDRAVLRAIHFYEECRRVDLLAGALRQKDFDSFLSLIIEGGHSSFEYNQNAYSIGHPGQQGVPLGLALSQTVLLGRGAWRLQGGGFAGTIQAFVPADLLGPYRAALEGLFGAGSCHVLSVRGRGAERVI